MLYKKERQSIKKTMTAVRNRYAAVSIFRAMVFCDVKVIQPTDEGSGNSTHRRKKEGGQFVTLK